MSLVRETDGEYLVRAGLPAVDVTVRIDNGVPALAGERKFEKAEQSEKVYRRESMRSTFSRSLALQDEGGQMTAVSAPESILIVDHDVNSACSLELMLHAAGHSETRVACSGDAALAIAAVFEPSVILLEVDLLDVNGYELAQTFRERARTRQLRLIALTTSREHEDRELARAAGFERYLLKPVAASDLSNLLKMPGRPAR
ncbi:MAG TPA: response regulator [Steroidobacteraceae bacterium]|nr:response regulator [Steroidobacteraceae bacterium]